MREGSRILEIGSEEVDSGATMTVDVECEDVSLLEGGEGRLRKREFGGGIFAFRPIE